ncbi:MAG: DUF4965 domain-containing protein [Planctomycetaceae bacterium]|jgi:hypothetical protein|nr:DUF4965 domain-containing protein [Planctomycetaceae bacterium]
MQKLLSSLAVLSFIASSLFAADQSGFRPPAVPLVVHDPYFSIWSPADKLTDAETVHWTGAKHPLHLLVRIDGKTYRLMGTEPADVPAMPQTEVVVGPLTTKYKFENETGSISVMFYAPLLPSDLELLSRPATYLTFSFTVKDSKKHDLDIYFDAGAEIAVNNPNQTVSKPTSLDTVRGNLPSQTMKVGTDTQNILGTRGDDVRIDWGHLIVSILAPSPAAADISARDGNISRKEFTESGNLKTALADQKTYRVDESHLVLAAVWHATQIIQTGGPIAVIAYDDISSIRYFENDLPAWWKKDGKSSEKMIEDAWNALDTVGKSTIEFEKQFTEQLSVVGGEDYAKLCALTYRQSLGAQKIVADKNGMPLMFSKENFSNGSIGTVDLMYPASPMLLYYSPALMKATLQQILDYGTSKRWKFPFAPHDVGTYPHATGQTYGGAETSVENQMPVEESANIIIQVAALAFVEGNADYAKLHWNVLTKWANYLLEKGYDPENQLCTDDFAGHLAHNINLSAKAIVGLGCYAKLAEQLGEKNTAAKYRKVAEEFAARWVKEATEGDHTRLAFDKSNTWSMKYNLMWDVVLGLKLFPREVIDREITYYKTKQNEFGLPLDNRSLYTKNDWILWTAAMTNNREDFDALLKPVIRFINNTDKRVPVSDWYFTDTAKYKGFQARSVVGGFWAPMLRNAEQWRAQAKLGANISGNWAPITMSEIVGYLVPTAQTEKTLWQYTFEKPAENWNAEDFNATQWKEGTAGFGIRNTPGAIVKTVWNGDDIWLRRTFDLAQQDIPSDCEVRLSIHHDEDVEVYLNGKLVLQQTGYTSNYMSVKSAALKESLRNGKNTFAVHCHQTMGGQYIDVGIVLVKVSK